MTKKIITFSILTSSILFANEVELSEINVESTVITEVAQNAQTSADLAQAISSKIPSVDMNRRSGIANDIYIRGQKRDNISIEVDGTKVCGACPNRMDPPVSHVLASQIDEVTVTEGPYDVSTFGTMSGGVKIKTKAPSKEMKAEINLGYGAFNYKKLGATFSMGTDYIRFLISASTESSDQYKDGDGKTLYEQNKALAPKKTWYQDSYKDMKAYDKKSILSKVFINPTDDQEIRLSYTANRSDDVMYPNTPMDAVLDDSDIYNAEYEIKNISNMYKKINFQYFYSEVDHPMSTIYRNQAIGVGTGAGGTDGMKISMTNHMNSSMQGVKFINKFLFASYNVDLGLDTSKRTWDGFYKNDISGAIGKASIDDSATNNIAVFAKVNKTFGDFNIKAGFRYDSTKITVEDTTLQDNDYSAFNANIFANYTLSESSSVFFGLGQASRVPDARELYFTKYNTAATPPKQVLGTDNLEQTTNTQLDLGYELQGEILSLKVKAFYSKLSDYIYYQKGLASNNFKNIDASIYGGELSSSIYPTDEFYIDLGVSYKRGTKDEALATQTDKDLADMAPLRGNISFNYDYMKNSTASAEISSSSAWDNYDSDNGEQALAGWAIFNLKAKHEFNKMFDFTLGVNNLFDKTYAISNTYADLTLLATGGTGDIILLNEPGRYIYTNLNVKF